MEYQHKPDRLIYASSYDRGLEHLLNMWSEIKRQLPEVELHVFYGWNLFDAIMHNNPERQEWKKRMNEKMKQDGIFHHGRVSHKELVENFKVSGVWAYPTHFGEISCQVAMMAQANGCVPVVMDYAALQETVKFGDKVKGDIYEPEVQDKYVKTLVQRVRWLKDEQKDAESFRKEMVKWAKHEFNWDNIAKSWTHDLFDISK